MAHISSGGKGGRAKTFEPNIVPFIDLMSVLITFLLISAVWTQVSMMQIGSSLYGKRSADQPAVPPPDADIVLKLDIRDDGYQLTVAKQVIKFPLLKTKEYDDAGLMAQLEKAKQLYPKKTDAAIAMQDELPYEQLIHGMDSLLRSGFPAISVLTGGPN